MAWLISVAGALIGVGLFAAIFAISRNIRAKSRNTPGTTGLISVSVACGVIGLILLCVYFA